MRRCAIAFAPATVANVAVGFDILGHAVTGAGDRVTVERVPGKDVVIDRISGRVKPGAINPWAAITRDSRRNTATAGLHAFLRDTKPGFGLRVSIEKGIAIGSGMGGSAASAVAAIVAANALLRRPLPITELFPYALLGEREASGSIHGDNIAPSLFGGLCLVRSAQPMDVSGVRTPRGLRCVLVHPHLEISTREARKLLKPTVRLKDAIQQTANLSGLLVGCQRGDLELIGRSLSDVLIEPQRKKLIPGFDAAKKAALAAGALGFSISGSGPSVFAWAASAGTAARTRAAILRALARAGLECDSWISPVAAPGARLVGVE